MKNRGMDKPITQWTLGALVAVFIGLPVVHLIGTWLKITSTPTFNALQWMVLVIVTVGVKFGLEKRYPPP